MEHSIVFLYFVHVSNNISSAIGAEKSQGLLLYEKALQTLAVQIFGKYRGRYGPEKALYLVLFKDYELYRAYLRIHFIRKVLKSLSEHLW